MLRSWKDREAACLALEAFISQRKWTELFPYISRLWQAGIAKNITLHLDNGKTGMQVLDDIRDSTRIAAIGFTKVLSQQIVRACTPDSESQHQSYLSDVSDDGKFRFSKKRETTNSSSIDDTTAIIIPTLIDKGLLASSAEGRGFSLGLLVQIVKVNKLNLIFPLFKGSY